MNMTDLANNAYIIISIVTLFISIVILIRWWGMTSDIKDIRNEICLKKNASNLFESITTDVEEIADEEEKEKVELMSKKLLPNQCIIKVKANSRIEVWSKETWEDHVRLGKSNYFIFLYKNY